MTTMKGKEIVDTWFSPDSLSRGNVVRPKVDFLRSQIYPNADYYVEISVGTGGEIRYLESLAPVGDLGFLRRHEDPPFREGLLVKDIISKFLEDSDYSMEHFVYDLLRYDYERYIKTGKL